MFVGSVVIEHEVNVESGIDELINTVEESQKLLTTMPRLAFADHGAFQDGTVPGSQTLSSRCDTASGSPHGCWIEHVTSPARKLFPGLANTASGCASLGTVVGAADFNGDGHIDLLWHNATSGVAG